MTQQTTPRPKRGIRWGRIVLILSLALNLLVLGLVGGAVVNRVAHGRDHPAAADRLSYGPYTRALDDKQRRALRRALREQGEDSRARRAEIRESFREFVMVLRADDFDGSRAGALLQIQQDKVQGQVNVMRAVLLSQIGEMSAAERAAFADRLERALRRGPRRGH